LGKHEAFAFIVEKPKEYLGDPGVVGKIFTTENCFQEKNTAVGNVRRYVSRMMFRISSHQHLTVTYKLTG
jgi:hypothetical protein